MGDSLARSALTGVAWNYSGAMVLIVTQIISTAVTARLIAPSQFGAYAVAQAAAGVFGYFTLGALGAGLLRRQVLGPTTVGTAVVLSIVSGGLVAVTMCLVAVPWSDAWDVPATSLVRVAALALFLVYVGQFLPRCSGERFVSEPRPASRRVPRSSVWR